MRFGPGEISRDEVKKEAGGSRPLAHHRHGLLRRSVLGRLASLPGVLAGFEAQRFGGMACWHGVLAWGLGLGFGLGVLGD